MLIRYARIRELDNLTVIWQTWEVWFADLEETHTSLPALPFFRSPQPGHSWITAAGALLDAAALYVATVIRAHCPAGFTMAPYAPWSSDRSKMRPSRGVPRRGGAG